MNTTTILIGTALLMLGAYTTTMRYVRPGKLGKLTALKDLFGDRTGNLVYLGTYSIVPLAAGVLCMVAGLQGVSLF